MAFFLQQARQINTAYLIQSWSMDIGMQGML